MRKPSIFSRDYERIMRKRKRILVASISLSIISVSLIIIFISRYNLRENESYLTTWTKDEEKIEKENEIETVKLYNNIKILLNGNEFKLNLSENNNKKIIDSVEKLESDKYCIDNYGEKVIILDEYQNIFLCDIEGNVIDLTLNEYVSPYGEVFKKDEILSTYYDYIWHSQVKFLNSNKIAYVSNLPYFGYGLSQFINVIDIYSKEHMTMWEFYGNNIVLKENLASGLEAVIDGNIKYIE
ncbi:Uncharacterised protein [uncultured Clostridium sp.]|uniref:hypothetical protein n=1 Tax=uncultured Clostridium sp. TaxID=59620 RepID=UPI00082031FD|nr:hypothetical protein [uncultured Clostridium sp.]SCJ72032.1 Uncharacterised protein [uncultured Clostridium sp.]